MLDILAPLALGLVCIFWTLFIWYRVRPNYEGWKKSPLFIDVAKFGAKNPERAWKIYLTLLLCAMDIIAIVLILAFALGKYSFYK